MQEEKIDDVIRQGIWERGGGKIIKSGHELIIKLGQHKYEKIQMKSFNFLNILWITAEKVIESCWIIIFKMISSALPSPQFEQKPWSLFSNEEKNIHIKCYKIGNHQISRKKLTFQHFTFFFSIGKSNFKISA